MPDEPQDDAPLDAVPYTVPVWPQAWMGLLTVGFIARVMLYPFEGEPGALVSLAVCCLFAWCSFDAVLQLHRSTWPKE